MPISSFILTGFTFTSVVVILSTILLLAIYHIRWKSNMVSLYVWIATYIAAAISAFLVTEDLVALLVTLVINGLVLGSLYKLTPTISLFGVFFWASMLTPALFGVFWLLQITVDITKYYEGSWLLNTGIILTAIFFFFITVINALFSSWNIIAKFSPLFFRFPRLQQGLQKLEVAEKKYPFVSIHVPCYNEPPDMVIETLNALTALNYPQFEVILLDNNTVNPEIWRPVEKHCKQLGERFHFYHFDTITGAKAGALNKCIQLTSPKAEIIAVFDSDYITKSDFLEKLVGYFNDPKVGFVQTCQDYRDWDQNSYQTACYYEYEPAYKLVLPGYNEWDVNYTIGTMCLIRRDVLEKVGGWAEWCLTEDSEAAVRIHAEGYTGYFLRDTYGKGLIPETFENYKLQRFRWSAGPAQQLQKHWRLYMPWGSQGKLTLIQKLGELNHSLAPLFGEIINFFIVFAILAICMWYAVVQHKHFYIPNIILFFIIATMFKNLIFSYIIIRLIGGKWKDYFLSSIASRSLIFISGMAYCRAWISNHIKWRRTDKFKTSSSVRRAISSSKPEFFAALVYFVISVVMVPFVSFWPIDVLFLIWISLLNRVITFLCAPFMAFLSEKNLEISLDSTYTRE